MMRISIKRISEQHGFTLIELLVTLIIMGVLASLATLAVGGHAERQANDEARRLYHLLGYASDEAALTGEEYGLRLNAEGYGFLRFDPAEEQWLPASAQEFADHVLPAGVGLDVRVENTPLLAAARRKDALHSPEVLILSTGEISSFHLDFIFAQGSHPAASISSDGSGTLVQE